jgi:hypothetical protein
MKSIAITAALALASTLSLAQSTKDQVQNRSEAPHDQTMPASAGDYWKQHAKGGYLTQEQWSKVDSDNDGRVSQQEWTKYHSNPNTMPAKGEAPANETTPANQSTAPGQQQKK